MEISKELFEKVMGIKLGNEHNTGQELMFMKTVVYYTDISKKYKLGDIIDNLNIHELAHKCKEWAYNDKSLCGYSIELKSYKSEFGYWLCELMSEDITFSGDTEPEAIFAACQWIIDNRS